MLLWSFSRAWTRENSGQQFRPHRLKRRANPPRRANKAQGHSSEIRCGGRSPQDKFFNTGALKVVAQYRPLFRLSGLGGAGSGALEALDETVSSRKTEFKHGEETWQTYNSWKMR